MQRRFCQNATRFVRRPDTGGDRQIPSDWNQLCPGSAQCRHPKTDRTAESGHQPPPRCHNTRQHTGI
ncbi:hypothetical protein RA21_19520 [Leisingera sp. ANG-DT]|nr:hypothetical protein RA21_19520 [Leisingera sp. ANG-DT]